MPRTLPWLVEHNERKDEDRVKQELTPRKRVKREPAPDRDITPRPPSSPGKKDFFRSSQTPPTSPARPCPPEEYAQQPRDFSEGNVFSNLDLRRFLIGGLSHDDGWIMVEDEFYAVAQSYTQHLHYAEYVRRKKEAKAQSAATIGELERPTDGRTAMPKEVQRRKDAKALATFQKRALEPVDQEDDGNGEETEDDNMWAGTHLHGLMTSPRKSRSLVGTRKLKSSTRAAAGFGQAHGLSNGQGEFTACSKLASSSDPIGSRGMSVDHDETASEDDDDLDDQARPNPAASTPHRERDVAPRWSDQSEARRPIRRERDLPKQYRAQEGRSTPKTSHARESKFKSRIQSLFDDLDGLPEPPQSANFSAKDQSSSNDNIPQFRSQNKPLAPRSQHNDVPTFLMQ